VSHWPAHPINFNARVTKNQGLFVAWRYVAAATRPAKNFRSLFRDMVGVIALVIQPSASGRVPFLILEACRINAFADDRGQVMRVAPRSEA
jgi:hypothetical protein